MSTTSQRQPVRDTTVGALALAAVSIGADWWDLHPMYGMAATGLAAISTLAVTHHKGIGGKGILYRMCCWVGSGAWLSWTMLETLWQVPAWGMLGVGALVSAILAPVADDPSTLIPGRAQGGRRGGIVVRQTTRLAREWEERIANVCRTRMSITHVRIWPNKAGFDLVIELPGRGYTRSQLESAVVPLAQDARLPFGCSIDVVGGSHQGEAILKVSTVNALAETITFPEMYEIDTMLNGIALGIFADSEDAEVWLREQSMLLAGIRGSGKTTLLQALSAKLGLTGDGLVWHCDLNGGGLSQPWVDVWLDGQVKRCPIDWAAPNVPEAKRMLRAGVKVAKHRKRAYRKLKRQHNASLLPISAALPQITIIVDEGAEAAKDRELMALISECQNIGRDAAVNVIISALRPTGDIVPTNLRKQSGVRIQMFGPDNEEIAHMFGWSRKMLTMDMLAGRGTGFISLEGAMPRPVRFYNLLPTQIEAIALVIAENRTDLDQASAEAAGADYATRYDRMRDAFEDLDSADDDGTEDDDTSDSPSVAPSLTLVGGAASKWADLATVTARPQPAAPAAVSSGIISGHAIPAILARCLAVFDEADDDRLHTQTLTDALRMSATDLASELAPYGVTPVRNKFNRNGATLRGYDRTDFMTALDRSRNQTSVSA